MQATPSLVVRFSAPFLVWSPKVYVKELTFSKLINECHKSLEDLVAESQQTLNLAQVVSKYPQDQERKTALQLQYLRENRLRLGYEARRDELLRLVVGRGESDTAA
jgi:hypothetical protein